LHTRIAICLAHAHDFQWIFDVVYRAHPREQGFAIILEETASAEAAGPGADVAQSILVTVWNSAVAIGGIVGGVLLETSGAGALAWAVLTLAFAGLLVAWTSGAHGFSNKVVSEIGLTAEG